LSVGSKKFKANNHQTLQAPPRSHRPGEAHWRYPGEGHDSLSGEQGCQIAGEGRATLDRAGALSALPASLRRVLLANDLDTVADASQRFEDLVAAIPARPIAPVSNKGQRPGVGQGAAMHRLPAD